MKRKFLLIPEGRITIACLIIAAAVVVIQTLSGHPYPTIPPVFLILLISAGLIFLHHGGGRLLVKYWQLFS